MARWQPQAYGGDSRKNMESEEMFATWKRALMMGLLAFGLAFQAGCADKKASVQEANKQLCRDYFQAFLKGDTEWMKKHIAAGFVRHDPGLGFEVKGPEGVKKLHDVLMPAFPDMKLPLLDFVAEGDKVLVRLKVQATHTGALGDMAATGKKIDIDVLDLFQFKDGVLIEHWALLDNLGMLKQLGAIPQ
jgi:predicted ester cyclase